MKKTTKNLFLGLGLSLLGTVVNAQDGLEKIIVEKYYISTAADSIGSVGILPVGSTTYRVYVDMLPGYRFQTLYGNSNHPLKFSTSTSFFNHEDRGATTANAIASAQLKNNTVALDSWFSVGASATGQFGVLKSEDDGKTNLLTLNSLLKNNAAAMGKPLTEQDGNQAGSPVAVTFVGIDPTGGLFDAISQQGNSFITKDGAISALGGATGPTSENRVLIGQFTTDGVFTFELNIQIGTPTQGVSEYYVVSNPIKGEKTIASLKYESNNVSITSPSDNATLLTGDIANITASAVNNDATVSQVEFFVDGKSIGVDIEAPYEKQYTTVKGIHIIKAIEKDNFGDSLVSKTITITVNDNQAPTVAVGVAASAMTGDMVALTATANDVDGTVDSVEFFVDDVSVGKVKNTTYTINWNATKGTHKVKAVATDNKGLKGTSKDSTIIVKDNVAPTVTIGFEATAMTGDMVALNAKANDMDGIVDSVEFFVDEISVGKVKNTPYSINWNATKGTHKIKAVATDNKGLKGTSKDSTIIVKDNVAPIVTVSNPANAITGDSIVITATATDTDGTVASVEFFVDDISLGTDATSPYSIKYKTTAGKHYIKAVATDNLGLKGTSKIDSITVVNNQAPVVTISTPKTAITGNEVTFTSTATDTDGTVTQVEFFVDNASVGIVTKAPYTLVWKATTAGDHKVKAIATDNRGFTGNSADSIIKVIANQAPTLTLVVDSIAKTNDDVVISATSTDTDGTVKKIEFYIDNILIATDSIAPYTTTWKATKGAHSVKAISFDNKGLTTTKTDSIVVTDKNVGLTSLETINTSIYPNPAKTELTIVASENAILEITDISGKVIAYNTSLIANTTHHIAVSDFSAGVYLVRIYNENYSKTERVVINN